MKRYDPSTEQTMKRFYDTLSEKDRRRYAGIEALKLGHGGIKYISQLLGCDRNTVAQGIEEVTELPPESRLENRVRQAGGGRKRIEVTYPDIDQKFLAVLKHHTAGDPIDETVRWTNLTYQEIAEKRAEKASKFLNDIREIGDEDAADEQLITILTHLARANLIKYKIFPASRPELPNQLKSIGENAIASQLKEVLDKRKCLQSGVNSVKK